MPHTKSVAKRIRTSKERQERNKPIRTGVKTAVKKAAAAAEGGKKDEAVAQFTAAQKTIDKAASKGVLHKKTAARMKSRLAKRVAVGG